VREGSAERKGRRLDADTGLAPMSPLSVVAMQCISSCLQYGPKATMRRSVEREGRRTGWCCPFAGGSTGGSGGSASALWQASAWYGKTCDSVGY